MLLNYPQISEHVPLALPQEDKLGNTHVYYSSSAILNLKVDQKVIVPSFSGIPLFQDMDWGFASVKAESRQDHFYLAFEEVGVGSPYRIWTFYVLKNDGSIEEDPLFWEEVKCPFRVLDGVNAAGVRYEKATGFSSYTWRSNEVGDKFQWIFNPSTQTVGADITLAVSPASAAEDGTTNLIYTFSRTGDTTNALTVNYSISGTADSNDYTGATPGTGKSITFVAGSSNATLTIDPTADNTVETNETVALTLATGSGYIVGTTSVVTGTITNDDTSSPTYILTPSATTVNEGNSISYNLTTTNVASGTSLYYQFSGTGINAADFTTATTSGTETVASNGQLTISRTLAADKATEGAESLTLRIFADSGATTALATISALTVNDTSLTPVTPTQNVYTEKSAINYKPTGTILAPLLYTTSTGDSNLSGLTLNVHYNSSILTPSGSSNGVSAQLPAAISSTLIIADTNNLDSDPLTDKILQLIWATFDNSFPNKTLPAALATVAFDTSAAKTDSITGQPLSTTVRYTAAEAAPNYDFLTGFTTFKAQQFNLDVDGDGKVTALGDGLMVIRKLFGTSFAGDALTTKARSNSGIRTTAEIHDFIQQGIDGGLLDVDKDGRTTALGDGLMVIRRLFGAAFDGAALTNKAIGPNSPYFGQATDFNSVGINIDALKPTFI